MAQHQAESGYALSTRAVARVAALLFVSCALIAVLNPDGQRRRVLAIAAVAVLLGAIYALLPYHRWPRSATLVLFPVTLSIVAAYNAVVKIDPYRYGIFFMVTYVWVGLSQRRWVALMTMPGLLAAYLAPLLLADQPREVLWSAAFVVPACVVTAELLAWLCRRIADSAEELRLSERRLLALMQNASDLVSVVDAHGTMLWQSPVNERVLGWSDNDVLAHVHPEDLPAARAALGRVAAVPGATEQVDVRANNADGQWLWFQVTGRNLIDEPSIGGIVLNATDVTARKETAAALAYRASHDSLTGLLNRGAFLDELEARLAGGDDQEISVLYLDLDGFKPINDRLGHAAGDAVLVEVARRIRSHLRASSAVGRIGGDEFTVLVVGRETAAKARSVAERLLLTLGDPIPLPGGPALITASIGVATARAGTLTADGLLAAADAALYEAKGEGRGRLCVATG